MGVDVHHPCWLNAVVHGPVVALEIELTFGAHVLHLAPHAVQLHIASCGRNGWRVDKAPNRCGSELIPGQEWVRHKVQQRRVTVDVARLVILRDIRLVLAVTHADAPRGRNRLKARQRHLLRPVGCRDRLDLVVMRSVRIRAVLHTFVNGDRLIVVIVASFVLIETFVVISLSLKVCDRRINVTAMRKEHFGGHGVGRRDPDIDRGRVVEIEQLSLKQLASHRLDTPPRKCHRSCIEEVGTRLGAVPDACHLKVERWRTRHLNSQRDEVGRQLRRPQEHLQVVHERRIHRLREEVDSMRRRLVQRKLLDEAYNALESQAVLREAMAFDEALKLDNKHWWRRRK